MTTVDPTTEATELGVIISSTKARIIIYAVVVILVLLAGAVQVVYGTYGKPDPTWLTASFNVLAYLSAPTLALSLANAGKKAVATVPVAPVSVPAFAPTTPGATPAHPAAPIIPPQVGS